MANPQDPAEFRRQATNLYLSFVTSLVPVSLGLAWLGWYLGGIWGLLGGILVGGGVGAAGFLAASFLWAMSQDGA